MRSEPDMLLTLLKPQVMAWIRVGGSWKPARVWRNVGGVWKPCGTFFDRLGVWVR